MSKYCICRWPCCLKLIDEATWSPTTGFLATAPPAPSRYERAGHASAATWSLSLRLFHQLPTAIHGLAKKLPVPTHDRYQKDGHKSAVTWCLIVGSYDLSSTPSRYEWAGHILQLPVVLSRVFLLPNGLLWAGKISTAVRRCTCISERRATARHEWA